MKQVEIHSLEVPMLLVLIEQVRLTRTNVFTNEVETRPREVPMLLASYPKLYTVIQDNIRNELQEWTVYATIQRDYTR